MRGGWMRFFGCVAFSVIVLGLSASRCLAQTTQLHISGADVGFPVAVPQMCDAGSGEPYSVQIADVLSKDLDFSTLFKVLNPASFVEQPGKCGAPENVAYSDWSVIGAEGLVKGEIRKISGGTYEAKLFLLDVVKKSAVVGKRYEFEGDQYTSVAHKFANEVIRYFTGEPGIFGTKIAFVSKSGRFKDVYVMDMDGTNVKQITHDKGLAISPSWSPSGDKIVYTSYLTRRPELYFVSPDGGSPRQLTKDEGMELGAEFSPDGRQLAVATSLRGDTNLYLYDLKGKITQQLTNSSALDVSPSWSPDGRQLVFCSNRAGGPQIYVMPSSGGEAHRISFTDSNYCTTPEWAPKGDKIAFSCRGGGNQLFISDTSGGNVSQITFRGNNEDPAWSPDGRYLAFSSDMGGGNKAISIFSLVSGITKQITSGKSDDSQPSWSPRFE